MEMDMEKLKQELLALKEMKEALEKRQNALKSHHAKKHENSEGHLPKENEPTSNQGSKIKDSGNMD
jgi:hypothetical protein